MKIPELRTSDVLLAAIAFLLIIQIAQFFPQRVILRDLKSGESAAIIDGSIWTNQVNPSIATQASASGDLITYSTGELEVEEGFDGPLMFFRNDSEPSKDFYIDMILYSWHSHLKDNPFSVVKLIYNATEPTGFFKATTPITMNQNFPNAAIDAGIFSIEWTGGNREGMTGSTGGGGEMGFTLQKLFNIIPFEGKIIIGAGQTQRFDFRTDSSGTLRLAIVGWFSNQVNPLLP
jgi:hypothetical protein